MTPGYGKVVHHTAIGCFEVLEPSDTAGCIERAESHALGHFTIDGKAEVKVPPGTSSGKKLRLRGKGVSDRTGAVGNHYVTIQIDVPGDLDDDDKKLLVQLVQRLRKRGQTG